MEKIDELEARIEDLRAQLHSVSKGDEMKLKAAGFRLGSMRVYEDVAGILRSSGKITCHYGTAAERAASTDYKESVFWWESDNEDLYMGTGAAWQMVGGASGAAPGTHKATHQHSGADEVATATPGANAIPKAEADGKIAAGWIDDGDISHDSIADVSADDHHPQSHTLASHSTRVIDNLTDVDTVSDSPSKSEVLKWNGSNWVPAVYNYNFTFSIASFSDGEATTQLIGTGVWEANEAVIFAATYNNGPPTSADVLMSIHGAAYNDVGHMDGPAYTAGKNYDGAINYPDAKDKYLRFRLDASDGVDPDIEYETAIYFRNKIYWGVIAKADTFTEADIEGLAGSAISNAINRSVSLNPGAGEYIVYAYPTSYTAMDEGSDYENDGGTDFKFNSIAIAMTRDNAALSITNSAGFQEDYDVYVSDVANLGSHTFQAHTSGLTIDPLYYGKTVKTDTFLEADIEGLANNEITNDNTQVWDSVTTGAGEYMLFAFPKRLGIPTFWVGGFEGGFEAPETVSVTNANGWTEDYYAWRSTNSNLGATVVETK